VPDTVALEIPREVPHVTRMSLEELRRELAIHLYHEGKLSLGKAREMAGQTVWAFERLLAARGIAMHYDVEDFEADLDTLRRLDGP